MTTTKQKAAREKFAAKAKRAAKKAKKIQKRDGGSYKAVLKKAWDKIKHGKKYGINYGATNSFTIII